MSALVHLAAPSIRVDNVIRQRCAWCGALIFEYDLTRIGVQIMSNETEDDALRSLVQEDGTPTKGWVGLVAIDVCEGRRTAMWAVDDPEDGKIPSDSCMALDIAATA